MVHQICGSHIRENNLLCVRNEEITSYVWETSMWGSMGLTVIQRRGRGCDKHLGGALELRQPRVIVTQMKAQRFEEAQIDTSQTS